MLRRGPCPHGTIDARCLACELPAVILRAAHLDRDISGILARVPHAEIVEGERSEDGARACLEGHKRAIRHAVERGWRRVLVLEDDCSFTPAFDLLRWVTTCDAAFAAGFDAVFGGTVRTHGPRLIWNDLSGAFGLRQVTDVYPHLVAVDRLCSAHCVAHCSRGYDAALRCEVPYDLQLGVQGSRCAVVLPFVAHQKPGMSGIGLPLDEGDSQRYAGPEMVNYVPLFRAEEARLAAHFGIAGLS